MMTTDEDRVKAMMVMTGLTLNQIAELLGARANEVFLWSRGEGEVPQRQRERLAWLVQELSQTTRASLLDSSRGQSKFAKLKAQVADNALVDVRYAKEIIDLL